MQAGENRLQLVFRIIVNCWQCLFQSASLTGFEPVLSEEESSDATTAFEKELLYALFMIISYQKNAYESWKKSCEPVRIRNYQNISASTDAL